MGLRETNCNHAYPSGSERVVRTTTYRVGALSYSLRILHETIRIENVGIFVVFLMTIDPPYVVLYYLDQVWQAMNISNSQALTKSIEPFGIR